MPIAKMNLWRFWNYAVYAFTFTQVKGMEFSKCNFEDTVDLSYAERYLNGSYLYENNIIIPANRVSVYDYEEIFNGQRLEQEPHIRGCLCDTRNCLKFCCNPDNEYLKPNSRYCEKMDWDFSYDSKVPILLNNKTVVLRANFEVYFIKIQSIVCENTEMLQPISGQWFLTENGILMLPDSGQLLTKRDYCLMPFQGMHDDGWTLKALTCNSTNEQIWSNTTTVAFNPNKDGHFAIGIISTPFIILTILMHIIRPEHSNLRGKCVIRCLTSMALGNTILATTSFSGTNYSPLLCQSMGLIAHLLLECSFIWLTLISYDIWRTSKTFIAIFNERRRLLNYSEYGWGIPVVITTILVFFIVKDAPHQIQPHMDEDYCWWPSYGWAGILYYFGLNSLIIGINIIFCLLALLKELPYIKKYEQSRSYIYVVERSLYLHLLLLAIISASFGAKFYVYLLDLQTLNPSPIIVYIAESICIAEGPLIFYVLVCRPILKRKYLGSSEFVTQLDDTPTGNQSSNLPAHCELKLQTDKVPNAGDVIDSPSTSPLLVTSVVRYLATAETIHETIFPMSTGKTTDVSVHKHQASLNKGHRKQESKNPSIKDLDYSKNFWFMGSIFSHAKPFFLPNFTKSSPLVFRSKMYLRSILNIVILLCCTKLYRSEDIPYCNFEDTVDLTHSQKFPNGSYLYGEDVIIPPEQVTFYNYEIIYDGEQIPRESHPRGCVCKPDSRNCIKFCCHPTKETIWNNTRECTDLYEVPKFDHTIKVISANGTRRKVDITKAFTMVLGVPCENAYPLDPDTNLHEKWSLFENGSLLLYYNLRLLSKRDFCMMPEPTVQGGDKGEWFLTPMVCPITKPVTVSRLFNNVADVISITFIILTIVVILVKPEKCNLQENCLLCFLISLAIGNIILASMYISDAQLSGFLCSLVGFSGFFFSVVSYFWLNVIYFDLMKSIVNRENHFLTYLAYGWGIPAALTLLLVLVQNSNLLDYLKPGIGEDSCWFDAYNWSALFYFYSINAFLLLLNIICYITTWRKMKTILQHQPTRKEDLEKSADQYGRLLILMVVLCCFETISNIESVLHPDRENVWYFVSDFVDALEGPMIFWIFAVKPVIEIRQLGKIKSKINKNNKLDMNIVTYLFGSLILLLSALKAHGEKCPYRDTVDLTNYLVYENGSYLYHDTLIPKEHVSIYRYRLNFRNKKISATSHVRGCVCDPLNGRYCIKLCCERGQAYSELSLRCEHLPENDIEPTQLDVITEAGQRMEVDIYSRFIYQVGLPCSRPEMFSPSLDLWDFYDDGRLLIYSDNTVLDTVSYCLTPYHDAKTFLIPMSCPMKSDATFSLLINTYAMALSVVFLIPTILVYLFLKDLREKLGNRILISYLFSIAVGYSIISYINISQTKFNYLACSTLGFMGYFFLMSAFVWLSVLCFDIWYSLKFCIYNSSSSQRTKRFILYSLYAWAIPAFLTALVIWAEKSKHIDVIYKPGIGVEICFLDTRKWSAAFYFYGPNTIILMFSIITFVYLICTMYKSHDSNVTIESQNFFQENSVVLLRLFIIMGISWTMDILSYCFRNYPQSEFIFLLTDFCNAIQGVLIFILFVLQPKVLWLLKDRLLGTPRTDATRLLARPLNKKILILMLLTLFLDVCLLLMVPVRAQNSQIPPEKCFYNETVDLRNQTKLSNGSYLYHDILIGPDKLAYYKHRLVFRGKKQDDELHLRGCICDLSKGKYCISLCCEVGEIFNSSTAQCEPAMMTAMSRPPTHIPIRLENISKVVNVNLFQHFIYKVERPCIRPEPLIDDVWHLNKNGVLSVLDEKDIVLPDYAELETFSYCIAPYRRNLSKPYELIPMSCPIKTEVSIQMTLNTYSMAASVIFLIPTILIYLFVKKLRTNFTGKMQICYLVSMLVSYSIISFINIDGTRWGFIVCSTLGFTGYFFFMSMYLWLNVLCFDMWRNFKEFNLDYNDSQENALRFIAYSLYAWGIAGLFTIISIWAQQSDMIEENYTPGIGLDICWLDTRRWSAAIYFYVPNLFIMIFNIGAFIHLTLLIYNVKRNVSKMTTREENFRENIIVIMRLFLIMGVSWITDIISYCLRDYPWADYIFVLTDICNASQGVLIFFLFIMRQKVIVLIKARFGIKNTSGRSHKSGFTMTTQFSKLSASTVPPTPTVPTFNLP
ncbi:uncharacterized protein LOC142235975 [Haematobia irritans]|uniref:uncharacterized protein LOC142235975 n=1 Tax=Haematobia irritans TaxID=7368 RepID=UPI003F507AF5